MIEISDSKIFNEIDENNELAEQIEPSVLEMVLNVGDWVVVNFDMEETRGVRKFIGQILSFNEDGQVYVDFLRSKSTSKFSGYIYAFPNIRDAVNCCKDQILYILSKPTNYSRALKFDVHVKNL